MKKKSDKRYGVLIGGRWTQARAEVARVLLDIDKWTGKVIEVPAKKKAKRKAAQ